jgi:hypothetical protein
MSMCVSEDNDALESLPLRLLIVAVVAALSVVPAAEALDALEDRGFLSRAGLMMDKVVHTAQMLSMQAPGASRTVEVDLSSDGSLRAVRLIIGDEPNGPSASALVLELSSGARIVRSAQDPPARMSSPLGQGLEVGSERFCLRMVACLMDGAYVVSVEVL